MQGCVKNPTMGMLCAEFKIAHNTRAKLPFSIIIGCQKNDEYLSIHGKKSKKFGIGWLLD